MLSSRSPEKAFAERTTTPTIPRKAAQPARTPAASFSNRRGLTAVPGHDDRRHQQGIRQRPPAKGISTSAAATPSRPARGRENCGEELPVLHSQWLEWPALCTLQISAACRVAAGRLHRIGATANGCWLCTRAHSLFVFRFVAYSSESARSISSRSSAPEMPARRASAAMFSSFSRISSRRPFRQSFAALSATKTPSPRRVVTMPSRSRSR